MTIRNRTNKQLRATPVPEGGEALPSNISLRDFAQAVAQLDLASIPPHKRKAAIKARVLSVAAQTIHDKQLASDITSSYLLHMAKAAPR